VSACLFPLSLNIRKGLIQILLLFCFGILPAQIPEFNTLPLTGDQIALDISTLPLNRFLIVGTSGNAEQKNMSGWLAVLNAEGTLYSEYTFSKPGKSLRFCKLLLTGMNEAILATESLDLQTFKTRAGIVRVSLNQQNTPSFLSEEWFGDSLSDVKIQGMQSYTQSGVLYPVLYGEEKSRLEGIIITPQNILRFDSVGRQLVYALSPQANQQGWLAIMGGISPDAFCSAVWMDSSFQIQEIQDLPASVFDVTEITWLNDSVWMSTGNMEYCQLSETGLWPKDIVILKGSLTGGIEQINCLGKPGENEKPGGMVRFASDDGFWVSYTPKYRIFVPQGQGYGRNRVPIVHLDSTGAWVQQYEYGTPAYYEVHALRRPMFGSDGKSGFICGSRYDIYANDTGLDAFWIKIPERAILSGLQSGIENSGTEYSLYPNPILPVYETLNIRNTPASLQSMEIYSLEGVLLQSCTGSAPWKVDNFPMGLYLVKLYAENQILYRKLKILSH